jgi:hypothetical protein
MGSFGVSAGQCTVPRQRKRVLPPIPILQPLPIGAPRPPLGAKLPRHMPRHRPAAHHPCNNRTLRLLNSLHLISFASLGALVL